MGPSTKKESKIKQLNFPGLELKEKKVKKDRAVIITDRDINIIEYILDMKFSSIQDVFEKFFKVTLNGEEAKSNEWAVRRLQQLEKTGYLKGTHSFSERTKFYLATLKGYQAVVKAKPEKTVLKPSMVIDHRTFDHDRYVLQARIMLEGSKKASNWVSDKKLRSDAALAGGLTLSNVPDGIYKTENGERVAFEMELRQKSKSDYLTKIKKYVSMMRSEKEEVRVFDKVLYVCAKLPAYEYLTKETKIYGEMFEVKKLSEFFPPVTVDEK